MMTMNQNRMTIDRDLPPFHSMAGELLIAMPGMDDACFDKSVIYICRHTEQEGAMGLVLNRIADKVTLKDLLEQFKLPVPFEQSDAPVFWGGPVELNRGFILHSDEYACPSTERLGNGLSLTSTQEVLTDIAFHRGPRDFFVALGRAGWARGQLEEEIMANVWLTVNPDADYVLHTPYPHKWDRALSLLGIRAELFSGTAGKA